LTFIRAAWTWLRSNAPAFVALVAILGLTLSVWTLKSNTRQIELANRPYLDIATSERPSMISTICIDIRNVGHAPASKATILHVWTNRRMGPVESRKAAQRNRDTSEIWTTIYPGRVSVVDAWIPNDLMLSSASSAYLVVTAMYEWGNKVYYSACCWHVGISDRRILPSEDSLEDTLVAYTPRWLHVWTDED
jgi:hypothetical protein